MIEILQELCTLGGISGREHQVADWIQSRLPAGVTVHRDPLGNLLVHKQGRERPSHRLMLCAHMDEVGLIINDITPEGLLGFSCVGGIDTRVLLARQVLVGERKIPGVIGLKPIHLTKSEERSTLPKVDELYIDIGASDREEARALVRLGDSVTFMPGVRGLGKTVLESKAIDDRLGCAVLLEMLREELPFDMDFAFTVQEEVGTRGASAAAYTIDPDFALIVETTTAADIVGVSGSDKVCEQGKGLLFPLWTVEPFTTADCMSLPLRRRQLTGSRFRLRPRWRAAMMLEQSTGRVPESAVLQYPRPVDIYTRPGLRCVVRMRRQSLI